MTYTQWLLPWAVTVLLTGDQTQEVQVHSSGYRTRGDTRISSRAETTLYTTYSAPQCQQCACGISNLNISRRLNTRIIGGETTPQNAYPWMVLITGNNSPACGGTLITDQYVLTAAHCRRYHQEELKVILGEHNHCEADNKVSIFSVEKIVTHPQFNITVYAYDIMLLKLNMRINFNEVVRPICLPQLAFMMLIGTGMGVTIGAHRFFTHQSFKANFPFRCVMAAMFTMSGENSICTWVRDHRQHHKYTDTDADPHNSTRGFFFSHCGWLMVRKHPEVIEKGKTIDISDLMADPVVRFQEKKIKAVENLLVSLLTGGEGWHNFHHIFPSDYRAAEYGKAYDLSTILLDSMEKLGLVYDLRLTPQHLVNKWAKNFGDENCQLGFPFTMEKGTVLLWIVLHLTAIRADADCGIQLVPEGRIVGGEDADGDILPWYALMHHPEDKTTPICSGTLIDSHHVITAAHCFTLIEGDNNTAKFGVTLGIHNRCVKESTHRTFTVTNVVLNPNYTSPFGNYDMAIMTLNQTTNYTPICLPGKVEMNLTNRVGEILGFGETTEGNTKLPCTLQRAYIQIFTSKECNESELPSHTSNPRVLCAGVIGGGVDSCQGDSGGPLQVVDNGAFVLAGIVSYGFGCGKMGYPGLYTNVYFSLDWIKENI
ncbi:uncharacterized protein LOC111869941 [Cryptotermes secundus]|uniref:uncharacterized protein LOC111869941 n=1 Tax=Cryptotermes secundus TaxID=105785 RepID=UPI001454D2E3|nr:uncharacterized protein LOC111869941 [Cryptotermes secundus]